MIHYFLPRKLQNGFLFLSSLIFYAWGEVRYVPLFFALLTLDWGVGLLLARTEKPGLRKLLLTFGIAADIGSLVYYKYSAFLLETLGVQAEWAAGISLPLGISFFTFQAVGYLVDVYRKQTAPEKSLVSFGTFLFLFPQLIAGPIIRYSDMAEALHRRRRPDGETLERGFSLFVAGLASKVLLANPLGALGEELKAVTGDSVCMLMYLCVFCLHLYFDFMGYSVMAVGMGRMLGFSFPRNFMHPFAASSVSDFWKRWYITLCGWFRDYVYFPLGGSRKGPVRAVINSLDHKPLASCKQEYRVMIDQFIAAFPDSILYVLSPPSGTEKAMQEKGLEARRFRDFRDFMVELAAEKGLCFLDFYVLLIDDQGFMDWRYDCGDGQHPHRGGYVLMEQLIRTHTVAYQ